MLTCLSFTFIVSVSVVIVTKVVAVNAPLDFSAVIINVATVTFLVATKIQPANAQLLLLFRSSH